MKVVPLKEAKAKLSECVNNSQDDRVLITKHGRPAALLSGVEGYDLEQVMLVCNPKFWELIEERRGEPTLTRAELEERL